MTLDATRLTLRLGRFEIISFGALILVFSVVTVFVAAGIDGLRPPAACFVPSDAPSQACELAMNRWYSAQNGASGVAAGLAIFLAFAAGIFLGVPIVAREIERGTARLAWSLAPSRMRWFLTRMLPGLVLLAVASLIAGFAADRFISASAPYPDLSNSFTGFGFRGILIASRAVFIFSIGVAVGAVVGRALPAIIFAALIATIGLAGGERVHLEILKREAVAVPIDQNGLGYNQAGDLYFDQKFVLPDGSLVDYGYFGGADPYDENGVSKYPIVAMVIPGERYRFVEAREALALAGGSLVALGIAAFVVSRRRPG
jgi:hypothetical protein